MKANYPYHSIVSDRPVIRAVCGGVPVYAFGYSHIYGEAPELVARTPIQTENPAPFVRIPIKRSHEIKHTLLGSTTPRMPRLTEHDERTLEPVHLIDGDPDTCWASRTQMSHDCAPTWIRLDLAQERTVRCVVLRKRQSDIDRTRPGPYPVDEGAFEVGRCMTDTLEIRVSRDSAHWETVYAGPSGDTPDQLEFAYEFSPTLAKQVMIIGSGYRRMENLLCCFSISNVEVYDTQMINRALVSSGCGITVSSVHAGLGLEVETHRWLWPVQHDLGLKWSRVGYHDDPINWHWVEREKGVLAVDPVADAAIDELVANGIQVVMCLNFGNRLYQDNPARNLPQMWEWYYDSPEPPKSAEALQAWDRFVRFMAAKYRHKAACFEIWNEWNIPIYWGDTPDVNRYIAIARRTIPIIRELAPEARVSMGSVSGFPHLSQLTADEIEQEAGRSLFLIAVRALAPLVDEIGFHPFYCLDQGSEDAMNYAEDLMALRAFCENAGFKGRLCASEFNIAANYPAPDGRNWWGDYQCSELVKAKYCAQISLLHTALDVGSYFCETYSNAYPMELSLMRRAFPQYPVTPLQPSPGYYVTRNMGTLLDGLYPSAQTARLLGGSGMLELHLLENPETGLLAAALWRKGRAQDACEFETVTLVLPRGYHTAHGVNTMNCEAQRLILSTGTAGEVLVHGLLIGDYPIMIFAQN